MSDSSPVQDFREFTMTIERDDPAGLHRSGESGDSAELRCRRAASIVGMILIREHGLPPAVVDEITREACERGLVFRESLREPAEWIAWRIVNRARMYMDLRGIELAPEEETLHLLELIRTRAALDTLRPDSRAALEMLCFEAKSWPEIAEELDVTEIYAKRLVTNALKQLQRWKPPGEPREE